VRHQGNPDSTEKGKWGKKKKVREEENGVGQTINVLQTAHDGPREEKKGQERRWGTAAKHSPKIRVGSRTRRRLTEEEGCVTRKVRW